MRSSRGSLARSVVVDLIDVLAVEPDRLDEVMS
jgi:hypothetical protein